MGVACSKCASLRSCLWTFPLKLIKLVRKPVQSGQTRPVQAKPVQARPDRTRPGKARPGQARPGQASSQEKHLNIERTEARTFHPGVAANNWHFSPPPSLFISPCMETSEIKLVAASLQKAINTGCQGQLRPLSVKASWLFFRTGYHLFKYCTSLWKAATVQRLLLQSIALPVIGSISSPLLPGNVQDIEK